MKAFICLFLFLFTSFANSQKDSALLVYHVEKDQKTIMLNNLLGVEYYGITCPNANLKGELFFISIDEYSKGKIIRHDDLGLKEGIDTLKMATASGETMYYLMDHSNHAKFPETDNEYILDLMSKGEGDSTQLLMYLPNIHITQKLKGGSSYQLRRINQCGSSDSMYVPLNIQTPILAFTPGFEMDNRYMYYCALGLKDVKDWYKEFKIEHYYVFNLLIK